MSPASGWVQEAWRSRGLLAWALRPLAWVYRSLSAFDRWRHRVGLAPIERPAVPVLVVGNWIAGGAGKTPTLLAVLELLQGWGLKVGVVSRGHGRRTRGLVLASPGITAADIGDEPLLIARRSQAPLAVAERRGEAARALLAAHPALQMIVSDDGLQHHGLARDLALWVFDRRGLGNGWLLPAGPLRQDREHPPLPGSRPDHLVLYSDGQASTPLPGLLAERRLLRAVPLAAWWAGERGRPLDELPAVDWCACAGLAQPQAFFDALRAQGIPLTHTWPRPDHDAFDTLPWPPGAPVLVTEKDAVKLDPGRSGCEQVWVCPLDLLPEPAFAAQLREQLRPLLPTWTPD